MKLLTPIALFMLVTLALLAFSPTSAPARAGDPTLDAALYAIAQATARAAETRQAAEATRQAAQAEEARARAAAQATWVAESLQQTRTAARATATAHSAAATATQEAWNLRATAEQRERENAAQATATSAALSARATATVAAISAQATRQALEQQASAEQRARWLTWGWSLLQVASLGIALVGGTTWVIWRIYTRREERETGRDAPPADDEIPGIPQPDVVYSPRAAEVISDALGARHEP